MIQPQTESPIEERLEQVILPHLHEQTQWRRQVAYDTGHGVYRVDFVAEVSGRRVAIECDGREFHEFRRDMRRDISLLASRSVHAVLRFTGGNIHHDAERVVAWVGWYEPGLFNASEWRPPDRVPDNVFRYSLMQPVYRFLHHGRVIQHKNPYR